MAMDKITQQMMAGDKAAIIDGFISSSRLDNVNAIISAVNHELKDKSIETQLKRLKQDETCLFGYNAGYKISDFAVAALHLLGLSMYTGADKTVIALIDSNLGIQN